MKKHYFSIDDYRLAKAMFNAGIALYNNALGGFGRTRGEVISFDREDGKYDAEIFNYFGMDPDEFDEKYVGREIFNWDDLEEPWKKYIPRKAVVFDRYISQSMTNVLGWDECYTDIYCEDTDDYKKFMDSREF